jgi:hypothetical protein
MLFLQIAFVIIASGLPLLALVLAIRDRPRSYRAVRASECTSHHVERLPAWNDYQRGNFSHDDRPKPSEDAVADIDDYCLQLNRAEDGETALSSELVFVSARLVPSWDSIRKLAYDWGTEHTYDDGDRALFDNDGRIVALYVGGNKWDFSDSPI